MPTTSTQTNRAMDAGQSVHHEGHGAGCESAQESARISMRRTSRPTCRCRARPSNRWTDPGTAGQGNPLAGQSMGAIWRHSQRRHQQ